MPYTQLVDLWCLEAMHSSIGRLMQLLSPNMFGSLVDEDDLSAEFVYVKYGKCDKVAH